VVFCSYSSKQIAHLSPAATDRCVVAFLAVTLGVAVATQSGPPLPPRDVARFWAAAATYGAFFAVTFLPGYTAPRSRLRVWCAFALRAVVLPLVLMALVQAPITLRTLTVGPRDGAAAWAAFAATRCPMAALAMLSSASARLPLPNWGETPPPAPAPSAPESRTGAFARPGRGEAGGG
jgi:hypothetical protein